jgi:hypothetical protein
MNMVMKLKGWEFVDHLCDCQLFEKKAFPWSWYLICFGYVVSVGRMVNCN